MRPRSPNKPLDAAGIVAKLLGLVYLPEGRRVLRHAFAHLTHRAGLREELDRIKTKGI